MSFFFGIALETVVKIQFVLISMLFLGLGLSAYMRKVNMGDISKNKEALSNIAYVLMDEGIMDENEDFMEAMEEETEGEEEDGQHL